MKNTRLNIGSSDIEEMVRRYFSISKNKKVEIEFITKNETFSFEDATLEVVCNGGLMNS